ncbi:MAG: hypothetical protein PHO37_07765 [Kiritimatiellae bacterium]|nr:hypothetical protein [Kiritimatiellia bacterium]
MRSMEIKCTACDTVAVVKPETIYEGFKKIGTQYLCLACGKIYPSHAETPFLQAAEQPAIFTDDDKPKPISIFTDDDKPELLSIFSDDERQKCCGWCVHFVVSPFAQRCGLTNSHTEATDLCLRFEKK